MTPEEPVEVYSAGTMAEAQFVHDLLAEAGIRSEIVGEALTGMIGRIPAEGASPRIWVRMEDEGRARPVIDEYQQRLIDRVEGDIKEPLEKEPYCYHCGQEIAQGQSPCPSCGKELDWNSSEDEDVVQDQLEGDEPEAEITGSL